MVTNIYNKQTKGPTLMELFTVTGKLKKKTILTTRDGLEYRIDMCRVTRGAHRTSLAVKKKPF
jgi:hypothetical protein